MGAYLTLEDAARKLGVEYKTLYRLVRSGELPAGRIGRVYRIREEDLEGYFEGQKRLMVSQVQGEAAIGGLRCGACGARILSELSIGGLCQATGKPICQACWTIKKIHECVTAPPAPDEEAEESGKGSEGKPLEPAAASVCGPAGAGEKQAAGEAARASAAAPPGLEPVEQVVARLRAEGRAVVCRQDVKVAEDTFLRSFAQRLEQVERLPEPLSNLELVLRKARVKHEVEAASRAGGPLPCGAVSRFTLRAGGWGRPKACLVIEGRFVCRVDAIAAAGFDAEPVTECELLSLLNAMADEAKHANCFRVSLVGSPTGWTAGAGAVVADAACVRHFRDRRLAAALVDLHTGRSWRDESDERLAAFLPILDPAAFAEKVRQCISSVREELVSKDSISLAAAGRKAAAHEAWMRAAFGEMARTGEFIVDDLPEIGLVASKR
jgi:excisionase family DNA binding protein